MHIAQYSDQVCKYQYITSKFFISRIYIVIYLWNFPSKLYTFHYKIININTHINKAKILPKIIYNFC